MFAKAIAIAAVTGFAAATQVQDDGFMAGAMKGMMLTNEHEMKDC